MSRVLRVSTPFAGCKLLRERCPHVDMVREPSIPRTIVLHAKRVHMVVSQVPEVDT